MQWVSIYGDSQSSLSEILLNSWKRFMGLFLRCWLKVWVLLIKLPQGWRRSPLHRPVWPPHPAGTHGRLPALQHLASKVLRQLVFSSTWPFPLTLFSPSYLYSPSTSHFFFSTPSSHPQSRGDFPTFPMLFVSFCYKLLGQLSLHLSLFGDILSTYFPGLFSPWPVCSTV